MLPLAWWFVTLARKQSKGKVVSRPLLRRSSLTPAGSDRWSAYHQIPIERRQLCWAHLRRDFQAMIDRSGEAGRRGEELLCHADMLFGLWHKVRDGTRSRRWPLGQIEGWLRAEVRTLLEQGAACGCAKTIDAETGPESNLDELMVRAEGAVVGPKGKFSINGQTTTPDCDLPEEVAKRCMSLLRSSLRHIC